MRDSAGIQHRPGVMSVGSNFNPATLTRSHSFGGFLGQLEKGHRRRLLTNPGRSTAPVLRGQSLAGRYMTTPRMPQPTRFEEIHASVKFGLGECLEMNQNDLENLQSQMNGVRRNSRLGFCYELDKQIKANERFIRRIEFHLSKVDELYEAYNVQNRLRDGANKMILAFTTSPASKQARESMVEVNRNFKECCERMCSIENEFENYLGEFHIKMKGLVGFARLCPGDHYEVSLRYGRQRWRLRGKIEADGQQSWLKDDMVLQPIIAEFLSIKVLELKRIAAHILVGQVTCDPKDLFRATSQVMTVDVNDLGTVKLNLTVTWLPFEQEDQILRSTSSTKLSSTNNSKKSSSQYSNSPPGTPLSSTKAYFDESDNGDDGSSMFSNSSSSLAPSSCPSDTAQSQVAMSTPCNFAFKACETDSISSSEELEGNPRWNTTSNRLSAASMSNTSQKTTPSYPDYGPKHDASASITERKMVSSGDLSPLRHSDDTLDLNPVELDALEETSITRQLVKKLSSSGTGLVPQIPRGSLRPKVEGTKLEEALQMLNLDLDAWLGQPGLEDLHAVATRLEQVLHGTVCGGRSRGSSASLTVESALGSFDFLNTDDDLHSPEDLVKGYHSESQSNSSGMTSIALTEDTGIGTSVDGSPVPMTTGDEGLDQALLEHMQYILRLLERLRRCRSLKSPEVRVMQLLDGQANVLRLLAEGTMKTTAGRPVKAHNVYPDTGGNGGFLSLWNEICLPGTSFYHQRSDTVQHHLRAYLEPALQKEHLVLLGEVMWGLMEGMRDHMENEPGTITLFQFMIYLEREAPEGLQDLIERRAREMSVVKELQTAEVNMTSLTGFWASTSPSDPALAVLIDLLLDGGIEKQRAIADLLSNMCAGQDERRAKVLGSLVQMLEAEEYRRRKAACKALVGILVNCNKSQLLHMGGLSVEVTTENEKGPGEENSLWKDPSMTAADQSTDF
uniref:rho family-interacting cell polarization regulator 2-like isoform X2 n=1 Tax=Myxine glutinosa TaxID=7769 RepID=UPI00358F8BFB